MHKAKTTSTSNSLKSHNAITLLTQGHSNPFVAKTAISMLRYRGADIVGILDNQVDAANAGELFQVPGEHASIPVVQDFPPNSDALYIGIAPPGGKLPSEWRPVILDAIRKKMDIVSGLHDFLSRDAELVSEAEANGVQLFDVRQNEVAEIANGQPFQEGCLRVLTVGQDCSVGKMVATLEVERGLTQRGFDSQFLATGQTGIMITGTGVPVDCVVADFVNGAVEGLVRQNDHHEFVLVEGQGSISHPAYSAVTLGLLHGCRPDGMIFCYEAGREQVKGLNNVDLPAITDQMNGCLTMANMLSPSRFLGFAVNTRRLTAEAAKTEVDRIEQEFRLPACDVYRDGPDKLVDACIALKQEMGSDQ